ncbi:MAG: YidC/Oxa1 family membrane protein insertase [bacterium]|nr:YidC/Oxa1 family membrane protein insertase [bacterium]
MLNFLTKPILDFLMFLLKIVPGHDLGIVIVLLTIVVRIVLFPLSRQSIKAQSKMASHKDQIKEIQTKYKTKEEQSRELMKFYKEKKINPFSGCLPLIVQLVILIALYQVFIGILNSQDSSINYIFLGFLDLSKKNVVLAVLAGISQIFASILAMKRTASIPQPGASEKSATMQKTLNRQMSYILPVFTVFIALKLPAGLALYWVISTTLGVIQDYYLYKKFATQKP